MFRSCFFALAMFSRQRRENIASVPAGLLAPWAKRTASRFASLTLRTAPRAGKARPGFRPAYFCPAGSKRTASRSAGADPPNCAPGGQSPPGVPAGLFSPFGLKTHGLQVRFAHPPKCALTRFARQRRANPASVPAGLLARWAKRTASRSAGADPPNFAPRGVPHGFQVRTGWARVLVRRGC